jgi:hypothetical protein
MTTRIQLLALADREFKQLTSSRPAPRPSQSFKAIRLNAARFDQSWDRKRGRAVRLTSVLLREDDTTTRAACLRKRSDSEDVCRCRCVAPARGGSPAQGGPMG